MCACWLRAVHPPSVYAFDGACNRMHGGELRNKAMKQGCIARRICEIEFTVAYHVSVVSLYHAPTLWRDLSGWRAAVVGSLGAGAGAGAVSHRASLAGFASRSGNDVTFSVCRTNNSGRNYPSSQSPWSNLFVTVSSRPVVKPSPPTVYIPSHGVL